ncbi:MAG: CBS domain-containing protein [Sandaracinaceae bacterium]
MHLIATHENADFDALAASAAAQKLSPGSVIGLGRRLGRPVREYWSLHKDRFLARRLTEVDASAVNRLTVVDLRNRRRMTHVEPILARRDAGEDVLLSIYDHHPPTATDVEGDVHVVEPVGAITTVLVERLRAASIHLDATEATLLALGIHDDTGSLTLGHTTPRDVRAFAWLLERGADLAMIERYLHLPFSEPQLAALGTVLHVATRERVGAIDVGVAYLAMDEPIDGLAEITAEARRLGGFDALLTFTALGRRGAVQVVGRSRTGLVDVGTALRAIGGGGHRGAAAAVAKASDPEKVAARVLEALRADPPRPRVVGEVMSAPLFALTPEVSLEEAATRFSAWQISGAPVVKGGSLVGVVSMADVERARAKGRAELPVTSHMSGQVRSTTTDAPLDVVLRSMVEHDIGRLPVFDAEGLVGIVTRTDIRRWLYASGRISASGEP